MGVANPIIFLLFKGKEYTSSNRFTANWAFWIFKSRWPVTEANAKVFASNEKPDELAE